MSEKPLERLNYYNGQRLEARDLKLEQEYHIRVRRWLNKSLYTSGRTGLAEVELDAVCTTVRRVHVGARRYVGAALTAKVYQYALEGERHVSSTIGNESNPARIYFHIRGRQPHSVTLYLRAE